MISADFGIKLENVTLEDLGSADRIVIDKDTTLIIGRARQSSCRRTTV